LGGERAIDLDVRVLAATNKDLRVAMAQREFREDLYFRLSTFKLRVPPLRERPGDILPLVARLLARHAQDGRALQVSAEAQACLQAHSWPGNVRELENVVLRAVVLCVGEVITPAHLMFDEPAELAAPPARASVAVSAQAVPSPAETSLSMPPGPSGAQMSAWDSAAPVPAQAERMAPAGAVSQADAASSHSFTPGAAALVHAAAPQEPASLQQAVQLNEHQLIMSAIQSTLSRLEAARKLGISPRTLRYKIAKLRESGLALSA
jgi:two-component system response regulator FlrC